MEDYIAGKVGSIRNPDGTWINSQTFRETGNHFMKHSYYIADPWGTPDWLTYWKEERRKSIHGVEIGGARITGEHYNYLNYSPILKVGEIRGNKASKVTGFPDFWDGDYNYFWVREIARKGIIDSLLKNEEMELVVKMEDKAKALEMKKLFESLNLFVEIEVAYLNGGYNLIVGKSRRKGYQLPHSEVVMTPYGKKTMGDISVGDEVSTPKGTAKVLELFPQGVDDVYKLTLYDGRSVKCGKEHLWKIYSPSFRKNYRQEKVVQTDFLLGETLKTKKGYKWFLPVNGEVENKNIKSLPIPSYTLGCVLGGGNVTKQFKVSGADEEVFDNIIKELGESYYFKDSYKYNKQLKYLFTKDEIKEYKKKGLLHKCANTFNPLYLQLKVLKLNCSSKFKYIPAIYKYHSSIDDRYKLVRGLMDTDGTISVDGSCSFGNISKILVLDLQEVLYSLGISSVFRQRKDGLYMIYINTNKNIFSLSRKSNRVKPDRKNRKYIPIIKVEKLGYKEESSCFILNSEDHLFLTNTYVVTHNSLKAASIGSNNYFTKPNKLTIFGAHDKKYLYPNGIFGMAYKNINFINENTGWAMPSDVIDRLGSGHIRASYIQYKNGIKLEKGFKSEILALTFKDNPDAARGKDAEEVFFEESGAFGTPGLLKKSYKATEDTVMAGSIKTGLITIFGCVCKGTKVYLPTGSVCNIEDISMQTGILGYGGTGVIGEQVVHIAPPKKKECLRIETIGGDIIECSTDHPLLWSTRKFKKDGRQGKKVSFKRAKDIQVGDQLMKTKQIPIFGKKKMPHARLIGLLIGGGSYGKGRTPELAINDKGIFNYVKSTRLLYRVNKEVGNFKSISIHKFQPTLRDLEIYGQVKSKKRLPKKLYEYDMQSLADLLGGYFDADGNVNLYKSKNTIAIRLTSVVKPLLEEIKEALRRFGVLSSIVKRKHKKGTLLKSNVTGKTSIINTEISYSLEITDRESLKSFKKYISFTDTVKKKRLEEFDCSINGYQVDGFTYVHSEEGKEYFLDREMNSLVPRFIKKITNIGMQDVYNLGTGLSHTYITNGFVSGNTSGDMSGGTYDYADMFGRPQAFDLLPFKNVWDEDSKDMNVGFFHPINWNMEGFYDENGNSDKEGAKQLEMLTRANLIKHGATSTEIQQRMQEKPLGPGEAFASVAVNNFPVIELKRQLKKVKGKGWQDTKGTPVNMYYKDGRIIAEPIMPGTIGVSPPITSYYNVPKDRRGCPVVYEQPIADPPKGLYKIGYDPIRQDQGTSLAAIIVYKSHHIGTQHHDIVVAEYIGRMETASDIDRIAEMFADLYGTKIMYENEVTGVKTYFQRIKRLNLLAAQPDRVISKNIKSSKVARVFGCHMNVQLKDAGERYLKEWLLTTLDFDEEGNKITVIDKIYSIRILEELIAYNRDGNFDAISALFMCMFQVQEEVLGKTFDNKKVNKTVEKLLENIKNKFKKY